MTTTCTGFGAGGATDAQPKARRKRKGARDRFIARDYRGACAARLAVTSSQLPVPSAFSHVRNCTGNRQRATGNLLMTRMYSNLAATFVALLHLSFILFVLFGGFLVLKWPKLMW